MTFSERHGIKKARDVIQADSIDGPLLNSLWNVLQLHIFAKMDGSQWVNDQPGFLHVRAIWINFFKRPVDELRGYWPKEKAVIRDWFFSPKSQWYEVYDLLEFVANLLGGDARKNFIAASNLMLERELSAFRFVGGDLTRISSETESRAVETALTQTHALSGVNAHLHAALEKLGDRTNPDYRNSIKESICAVEAMCQMLAGEPGATLGVALKQLRAKGVEVHGALEKAWLSLYGYTNDEGGIRHAMLDEATLTQSDARYMLVSCSAFISHLIDLAARGGVPLTKIP